MSFFIERAAAYGFHPKGLCFFDGTLTSGFLRNHYVQRVLGSDLVGCILERKEVYDLTVRYQFNFFTCSA